MGFIKRNYNLIFIVLIWILTVARTISFLIYFHDHQSTTVGTTRFTWFTSATITEISQNLLTAIFFTAFLIHFHRKIPTHCSECEE
jgi:hypothetical protein